MVGESSSSGQPYNLPERRVPVTGKKKRKDRGSRGPLPSERSPCGLDDHVGLPDDGPVLVPSARESPHNRSPTLNFAPVLKRTCGKYSSFSWTVPTSHCTGLKPSRPPSTPLPGLKPSTPPSTPLTPSWAETLETALDAPSRPTGPRNDNRTTPPFADSGADCPGTKV